MTGLEAPPEWTSAMIRAIICRRRLVLAAAATIVAASVVLALRLALVTDLAALLPDDDPAVAEIAAHLRARGSGIVGEVVTLDAVLPGSPELTCLSTALLVLPAHLSRSGPR